MFQTKIAAQAELGHAFRKILCIGVGLLATSCAIESPPLELNAMAQDALAMDKVHAKLDAQKRAIAQEIQKKSMTTYSTRPAYEKVPVSQAAQLFVVTPTIENFSNTEPEMLIAEYLMPQTDPARAMRILNVLANHQDADENALVVMQRVENTQHQAVPDVNAYTQLLDGFFAKASPEMQLRILDFVRKNWHNTQLNELSNALLQNCMVLSAKTLQVRQRIAKLLGE